MQTINLEVLAREQLEAATRAASGRSARTLYGGGEHRLHQTLMALRAGRSLAEHQNPGEATLQVLTGRILLKAGEDSWDGWLGDLLTIPDASHSLDALEDSVILLTVVKEP